MNWEAVQALGELIAALGVIVSLLYLSRQVRDNTRSMRSAANQDLLASLSSIISYATSSEYGSRIYRAVCRGAWDELTPDEAAAGRVANLQALRLFEQAFLQHRAGLLEEDVWTGWRYQIVLGVGLPGFAGLWAAHRPMVNDDFARWIDSLTAEGAQALRANSEAWRSVGVAAPYSSEGDA